MLANPDTRRKWLDTMTADASAQAKTLDAPPRNDGARRHHVLIAGSGRAGTSFLVRYLSALGLETEIDRSGVAQWDENANAGHETLPIITAAADLPYVIKTPWTYQFVEQLLAQDDLAIDLVIIPVRNLMEAAASRVIVERRTIHEQSILATNFDATWDEWCWVPGGAVYSLNVVDQARVLAVGFHRLIHRLAEHDIPMVFLPFPRLVDDGSFLFSKLRPFLPANITAELAAAAHRSVVNAQAVRTEGELASMREASSVQTDAAPSSDQLDLIAMKRELRRLKSVVHERESALLYAQQQEQAVRAYAEQEAAKAMQSNAALLEASATRDRTKDEYDSLTDIYGQVTLAYESLRQSQNTLTQAHESLRQQHDTLARTHAQLSTDYDRLKAESASLATERDAVVRTRQKTRSSPGSRLSVLFRRLMAKITGPRPL